MARGDIADVNLPLVPGTRAQGGRRPGVLVIADTAKRGNPMTMVVPITKTLATQRFPFTLRIDPSSSNGLTIPSVALVFQVCAVDITQLDAVRGHLEDDYMRQIDVLMRELLGL